MNRLEKAGVLTKDQIFSIFSNVKDVLKVQNEFLRELEETDVKKIGDLFIKWV